MMKKGSAYKITENIHKQNQHGYTVAASEIIHNCVHFIKVMWNKCGIKAATKYDGEERERECEREAHGGY